MDGTSIYDEAIGRVWPEAVSHLSDENLAAFEDQVLSCLRRLAGPGDDSAHDLAYDELIGELESRGALRDRFIDELDDLALNRDRAGRTPTAAPPDLPGAARYHRALAVPLYFGTDRLPTRAVPASALEFGGDRGPGLVFGTATVNVPDDHRLGLVEKPKRWRLRFPQSPADHVRLDSTAPLDPATFSAKLSAAADTHRNEALVFVHGYHVAFENAARRAAQIAYDVQFPGVMLMYSWPSRDATLSYPEDEGNVEWSVPHFREFLRTVLASTVDRIHILAHSMGNRLVLNALANPDPTDSPALSGRLGQVVFAAPDVDTGVFTQLAPNAAKLAERCTLYCSSKDRALAVSRKLAGYPRAGQSGRDIAIVEGIDTIDATGLDTGFLSHSYFGDRPSVIADLFSLLRHGHPPGDRFGLGRVPNPRGDYWAFATQRA